MLNAYHAPIQEPLLGFFDLLNTIIILTIRWETTLTEICITFGNVMSQLAGRHRLSFEFKTKKKMQKYIKMSTREDNCGEIFGSFSR